jgi:hypothetical protein
VKSALAMVIAGAGAAAKAKNSPAIGQRRMGLSSQFGSATIVAAARLGKSALREGNVS